jgi:hypothetical protein
MYEYQCLVEIMRRKAEKDKMRRMCWAELAHQQAHSPPGTFSLYTWANHHPHPTSALSSGVKLAPPPSHPAASLLQPRGGWTTMNTTSKQDTSWTSSTSIAPTAPLLRHTEGWMTVNDEQGHMLENGEDGEQLNLPFICCSCPQSSSLPFFIFCCSSPQSSSLPFFIFCCSPKSPPSKCAHTCPKRCLNPSRTRPVQPVYNVFGCFWPIRRVNCLITD